MRHLTRVGFGVFRGVKIIGRLSLWRPLGVMVLLSAGIALSAAGQTVHADSPSSTCVWHTVVPDDTLGSLGSTYHTTGASIALVNHLADSDAIYVGQQLCIMPGGTMLAAAPGCLWHMVVAGDTLASVAQDYGSSVSALARANHIADPNASNAITVGQWLCLVPADPAESDGAGAPPGTSGTASTPAVSGPTVTPAVPTLPVVPPGNARSVSGVQAFIQFVVPYARAAHVATGWPTSLILAQWGLEQGWHLPGYTGYNFGNSGPVPGQPLIPGLNVPGSPSAFSYAPTPADGLQIYIHVTQLSYYMAVAPAASWGGVDAAARALGQSPWDAAHYTSIGQPGSSLLNILHAYNLYWYDTH